MNSMIEALPDHHPFKPGCLFELSRLFESAGKPEEQKPLLVHALTIERLRGDDRAIALALRELSDPNWGLDLYKEGVQQWEEVLEIFKRAEDTG